MTLRDWLPIVGALLIPVMIALGTWGITWQQGRIEDQRAGAERKLAEQQAQDEALQAYLDQMSQLMLDRKLLEAEQGDPVHTLAQARTSTVILSLDAEHNESVTRFLIDSGLAVSSEASPRLIRDVTLSYATLSGAHLPRADLSDADLSEAYLRGADLSGADLSDAFMRRALLEGTNLSDAFLEGADLMGASLDGANLDDAFLNDALLNDADLSEANLYVADLSGANLGHAFMSDAFMIEADLSGAELSSANLSNALLNDADLSEANLYVANLGNAALSGADLSDTFLSGADLLGADLDRANLSGAQGWTEDQLSEAVSLEGATMPNGQKYEDWLKSKDRE